MQMAVRAQLRHRRPEYPARVRPGHAPRLMRDDQHGRERRVHSYVPHLAHAGTHHMHRDGIVAVPQQPDFPEDRLYGRVLLRDSEQVARDLPEWRRMWRRVRIDMMNGCATWSLRRVTGKREFCRPLGVDGYYHPLHSTYNAPPRSIIGIGGAPDPGVQLRLPHHFTPTQLVIPCNPRSRLSLVRSSPPTGRTDHVGNPREIHTPIPLHAVKHRPRSSVTFL